MLSRGGITGWINLQLRRDPAPSPAGYGSDFPKLSAQRPAVSLYCPLILQQAIREPLLFRWKGTFHHRGIKKKTRGERSGMRCRSGWNDWNWEKQEARDKRWIKKKQKKSQTRGGTVSKYPNKSLFFFSPPLSPCKPALFWVLLWFVGRVARILCLSFPSGCSLGDAQKCALRVGMRTWNHSSKKKKLLTRAPPVGLATSGDAAVFYLWQL